MFRTFLCLAALVAALVPAGVMQSRPPASAQVDEFVGPFSSWTDVKAAYGAVGDGVADDTAALQRALAAINSDTRPVLYLPAGTYRLTSTLQFASQQLVSIIGADPAEVTLVWDGPEGGTMLWVNGVAYSRINRIRFDGRHKADIAVDQSADGKGRFFDTGNEYADDEFVDVGYGIRGGFKAGGFAETSIVRGRFLRNTKAGVALGNFNALDAWVWSSLFDHCAAGVSNNPGAGNFRVYDSVFRASTTADLVMDNTGLFTARGNHSTGSKAFYVSTRTMNHPASIDIQHNVIIDPVDNAAIHLTNQGPGLILDNVFRSRTGAAGPVITWQTAFTPTVASIGNTFTVANAVSVNGTLVTTGDRVVARASITADEPALPPHPARMARPIIDIAPGAEGAIIQAAIDRAAAMAGQRPVVHVSFGAHAIDKGLELPAGDIQLVGDGFATVLAASGGRAEPVLHVAGPTQAVVRDFSIRGVSARDGLVIDGVDQSGARVRFDGLQARGGAENNLRIDQIANAAVELIDFNHTGGSKAGSVRIAGAPAEAGRPGAAGRTVIFSGASSDNALSYDIGGGLTVIRDVWYEGKAPAGFARIHGGANLTMQGLRVATSDAGGAVPAIVIDNAGGTAALLTLHMDDRIALTPPSAGDVLGLGLFREFSRTPFLSGADSAGRRVLFALMRQRVEVQGRFSVGSLPIANIGTVDPATVAALLADTRAIVSPSTTAVPSGATDLRISRVASDGSRNNVVIRR